MPSNCTIILVVQDSTKFQFSLLKNMLDFSGVNFELIVLTEKSQAIYEELNPSKVFAINNNLVKCLNGSVEIAKSSNLVFVNQLFIPKKNWLKDCLTKINQCKINCLIAPYISYIQHLEKSEFLNPYGELYDCLVPTKNFNDIFGVHIFNKQVFNNFGGFVFQNLIGFEDCIIHYRQKIFNSLIDTNFIHNVSDCNYTAIIQKHLLEKTPLREFTPIEEIAFHNLDNLIETEIFEFEKFMLPFFGKFGFRCNSINKNKLEQINNFATYYDLTFEINTIFPQKQNFKNNLYVLMARKN